VLTILLIHFLEQPSAGHLQYISGEMCVLFCWWHHFDCCFTL